MQLNTEYLQAVEEPRTLSYDSWANLYDWLDTGPLNFKRISIHGTINRAPRRAKEIDVPNHRLGSDFSVCPSGANETRPDIGVLDFIKVEET